MLFSELYSAYYNTVADILKEAVDHPLQDKEINRIIEKKAFFSMKDSRQLNCKQSEI